MEVKSIDIIKSYLTEGKYPTASELVDIIDTLVSIGQNSGGDTSGLATVATTGDYNDLLNLPTLFSGNYNDLTNKPTLFSGSYEDLTGKPTLFSGNYNDLTNKPTIPANLSDLSDDSTHRLVTDTEKVTWNNKSDFSGSYNDLTDKPTIPTVPTISTNITSDATSDTKTTSPKAVKDFVEGKGYLTQHQDISGKADQTDLEALEDRVETLEQSSGSGGTNVVDSAISSTSEHALQNKVLYDELRITEQSGSQASVTIDGTTYPIVVIDANDFNTISNSDGETIYVIPSLETEKAYKIIHSNYKCFIAAESEVYILLFCGDNATDLAHLNVWIAEIFEGQPNTGSSITTGYWNEIEFNDSVDLEEGTYYGVPVDGIGGNTTQHDDATETQGSGAFVVKSLKTKIAELEARIEQISAQLQS